MSNVSFEEFPITFDPSFTKNFEFEKFDVHYWRRWVFANWTVTLYISGIYMFLIHRGQKWMKDRSPMDLKKWLVLWNTGLALFSLTGFLRSLPEFAFNLKYGLFHSICQRFTEHSYGTAFWGILFMLSKVVELGDTAFIILRKKNLIFLHWYHHITVMIYCWYFYPYYDPVIAWFSFVNYFVHSLMYAYFALMAAGFKMPRYLAMCITTIQLSQMVVGVFVCCFAFYNKAFGGGCLTEYKSVNMAMLMYASYFILFAEYFRQNYFTQKTKVQKLA